MEYDVSLFQSTGECLHFSVLDLVWQYHFFDLYFYINAHKGNKEIIMCNKEIYIVLKFYTFISCNCSSVGSPSVVLVKEALSPGFWRMPSSRATNHAKWILYCGPSLRSGCIKGVLLQILPTFCWDTSSIPVEHRDPREKVLGRALHYKNWALFRGVSWLFLLEYIQNR